MGETVSATVRKMDVNPWFRVSSLARDHRMWNEKDPFQGVGQDIYMHCTNSGFIRS
jgi:hypothetical protein